VSECDSEASSGKAMARNRVEVPMRDKYVTCSVNYCRRIASCLVKLHYVIALETRRNWTYVSDSYRNIAVCKEIVFVVHLNYFTANITKYSS
jgi:hypothetical protein